MSSNNTTGTKCNKTPVSPLQLTFLMETFSILASLGLNPVWFTSISKLTDGPYPDYVQVCRLPPPNADGPPRSSLTGSRRDEGTFHRRRSRPPASAARRTLCRGCNGGGGLKNLYRSTEACSRGTRTKSCQSRPLHSLEVLRGTLPQERLFTRVSTS